jgi:antirestriction protein ArdC
MSAAFCCASLGIVPTVRHADYIGFWLDLVRQDNRAIVRAASAASKAADYLLAFHAPTVAEGTAATGIAEWCDLPHRAVAGRRSISRMVG